MSITARLRNTNHACTVSVDASQPVASLLDSVHAALSLPLAAVEYVMVLQGDDDKDGVDLAHHRNATLGNVGVYGCGEEVEVSVSFTHVARATLRAEGVADEAAAFDALCTAVGDGAHIRADVPRVCLLAASGLVPAGTCLIYAVEVGAGEVVAALLDAGVGVDHVDVVRQRTPLSCAVETGSVAMVKLLLARGAAVEGHEGLGGFTLAVLAVVRGSNEILAALLEGGADPDAGTRDEGWTPLHLAVERGRVETVRLLLRHGASPNIADGDGTPPLYIAADNNLHETAAVLLAHGADVDGRDAKQRTPLMASRSPAMAALLLEHGAAPDVAAADGMTPLFSAVKRNPEALPLLAARGVSLDAAVINGAERTPLAFARHWGRTSAVAALLELGARDDGAGSGHCDGGGRGGTACALNVSDHTL